MLRVAAEQTEPGQGQIAAARPTASVSTNASAPPRQRDAQRPLRLAGADIGAHQATNGAPRPNTSGISRYSSRAPVP